MAQGGGSGGPIIIIPQLTYTFSSPDKLSTSASDNKLIPWQIGRNNVVSKATANVKTPAPVGADVTIDVKLMNRTTGAVISTLGTITIPAGALLPAAPLTFTPTLVPDTQALAIFVTQVGSPGTEGTDLTVQVFLG